ncbi:MAG: YgiT-type zinc finger protein [Thermosynechococcaceae cyanobacterium]
MEHLEHRPICGGELTEKSVTKVLRGGGHTASMKVRADVCLSCGERVYLLDTIKHFQEIRAKLKSQDTHEYVPTGQAFQIT